MKVVFLLILGFSCCMAMNTPKKKVLALQTAVVGEIKPKKVVRFHSSSQLTTIPENTEWRNIYNASGSLPIQGCRRRYKPKKSKST